MRLVFLTVSYTLCLYMIEYESNIHYRYVHSSIRYSFIKPTFKIEEKTHKRIEA